MPSTPPTPNQPERDRTANVIAVVEEHEDGTDRCTIYPDSDSRRFLTEWLTAAEGSFVSIEAMR